MEQNKTILIGAITGAHGIKGAVRVRSFAEEPENIFLYSPLTDAKGEKSFALHCVGVIKEDFIATIKGVTDRTQAEALKGTKLYMSRDALPPTEEEEYYEADLRGLEARDETGAVLGHVDSLHDYGAGSFLEIKPAESASFMIPFKDSFVPKVSVDEGFLTVLLPEDWLKTGKPKA